MFSVSVNDLLRLITHTVTDDCELATLMQHDWLSQLSCFHRVRELLKELDSLSLSVLTKLQTGVLVLSH